MEPPASVLLLLLAAFPPACGACSEGSAEPSSTAIASRPQVTAEAPAHAQRPPFWSALAALDLAAARKAAAGDEERRFAGALECALRGGSPAAGDELCALGSDAKDPQVRRWAGQTLLNLLRNEARWEELVGLRERCPGLPLSDKALPAALAAFPRASVSLPDGPVVLPLLDVGVNLAVVTARVAGSGGSRDVPAVIDTGSVTCMIAADLAEALGVRPLGDDALTVVGGTGARVGARPGVLDELGLGGLVARDVPVSVLEPKEMRAVAGVARFVVGWEILQRVVFEIAGAERELVLRRSVPAQLDGARVGAPDAPGGPNLVLLREPVVRLRSGDVPLLFLLDTGSSATDARPRLAERLGARDLPVHTDTVGGLGQAPEPQALEVRYFELLPLSIGDLSLTIGNVSVLDVPDDPRDLLWLDGTLGVDLGLAARLVVDASNRRVELRAR
jgi:Aspartyl protease